jgi:hypothetical protein
MQKLKDMINYTILLGRVDKFPDILEEARETFKEIRQAVTAELADPEGLQVIHGDFWTGK